LHEKYALLFLHGLHLHLTFTFFFLPGMWRLEGVSGFYRGMIPNYLKVVPSISITFLVYEWMKTVLDG
jgi:hypothetical protein